MGRPSGLVCAPTRTVLPELTLSAHPAPQSAAREEWGRAARGVLEHAVWTVECKPTRPFTRTPPLLGQPQRPLGAQRAHGGQSLCNSGDAVEMGHHTLPEGGLTYRRRQRVSLCQLGPMDVKTGGPRPPARLIPHPPPVLRIECPLGQRMGRAAKAVRAFGRVYGATPWYVRSVRGVYVM
jgi:hypothetical protein